MLDLYNVSGHVVICHTCTPATCCLQAHNIEQAFNACNAVLESDSNNVHAYCDRAETYIANEQYEEGT